MGAKQIGLLVLVVLAQRLRFSFTSRMPTVICVGRSDRIGTGCTLGSRALGVMIEGPFNWLPRLGSRLCHGPCGGNMRSGRAAPLS